MRRIYASTEFDVWCQENELADSNTFLIASEGSSYGIVIDPGSEVRLVSEFLQRVGISQVDVLLTHGHFDHVCGVAEISNLFSTRVFMNPDDEIHLKRNNFYLKALGEKRSVDTFDYLPFPTNDELLKSVQVISAPGHTKGGVLFSVTECVFVGDLIMRRKVFSATVPGHNKEQWALTVRDIWPMISAHKHVFLGHGGFTTPDELLVENSELRVLLGL